ncbi:hypothetical protein EBR57_02170 [bacterium]|nr:hypothetical protein [bacterium]
MKQVGLCWIRRDIRLHDHAAFLACVQNSDITHIVFVFDELILAPVRLVNSQAGWGLWIQYGNPTNEIPKLVRELGATSVYFNRDYIPSSIGLRTG